MKDSLLTDWGERGIRHAIHIKQLCRSGDRMDTNVHKESNVCSRTARKDETLETLKFNDGFIKATAAGTPKLFLKLFFLFRFHTSASPTVQFRYQWWQRVCVCVFTVALFLQGPRLRHSETLHDLVLLPCLLVLRVRLIRWPLQHATVEGVATSPVGFLRPRPTVHWTKEEGDTKGRRRGEEGLGFVHFPDCPYSHWYFSTSFQCPMFGLILLRTVCHTHWRGQSHVR